MAGVLFLQPVKGWEKLDELASFPILHHTGTSSGPGALSEMKTTGTGSQPMGRDPHKVHISDILRVISVWATNCIEGSSIIREIKWRVREEVTLVCGWT